MIKPVSPIHTLLVSNRGEIALRVIQTAKSLGIRTVAVYSDIDAHALHVREADEAVRIGPAPAALSYLNIRNILDAAKAVQADAVHPGYGFLSENAEFAAACAEARLAFVGPPPHAIAAMGDKARSKTLMTKAGVPCAPGYNDDDQSNERLLKAANEIGFPVMIKAAAGGGGRGMRRVETSARFLEALESARADAASAFGSRHVILERAIDRPRHIEVQIFADRFGSVVHLGERDCSAQRRYQKIIEEAPAPNLSQALREKICRAAVKAARAVDYLGAGTVEFLLDESGDFFFMEMNTRLQVEHPVTEMVTGLDLVALQLRVAEGHPLGLEQDDIRFDGHAIEARIYAEHIENEFAPASGLLERWAPAASRARVDAGLAEGEVISPYYDTLIAKIITHRETREQARRALVATLKESALFGPPTNRAFLTRALGHAQFVDGVHSTRFLREAFDELTPRELSPQDLAIAAALLFESARKIHARHPGAPAELLNWFSASRLPTAYRLARFTPGQTNAGVDIQLVPTSAATYRASVDDAIFSVRVEPRGDDRALIHMEERRHDIAFHTPRSAMPGQRIQFSMDGEDFDIVDRSKLKSGVAAAAGDRFVAAPMHGVVQDVRLKEGDSVAAGDRLATLEAMKMQHAIKAALSGRIQRILCASGDQVDAGAPLFEISAVDARDDTIPD